MSRYPRSRHFLCAAVLGFCATAHAEERQFRLVDANVQQRANGVLALMGYTVVPDVTTSSLSIKNVSSGDAGLNMTQLGGGATMSQSVPVYLEGALSYARYDPTFIATNGQEERRLPLKWNSLAASGGIGWDFPIAEHLVIRPIFNIAIGQVASDLSAAKWYVEQKVDRDFSFLDGGSLSAYGLGGSIMLDYEDLQPERDIDIELRYSNIPLKSFGNSDQSVQGRATAESASLWARYRAPISDWSLLDRPFRYVLEFAQTQFIGDLRGALGFNYLTSLGLGVELDSSKYDVIVTRTRLVTRYVFGNNVSGISVGLACSF
ncbi:autotransporter domain-containing protein [Jeongeupia naejangsanensis]|uniref:Autotransporter domain-containing protein n=1 Tax=Jeongeupia naejangsanensis TaxID=613195 RepID=A0ABS2BGQ3_9NEIS|nr:autotransporter domain-containing protein [Jeongeupia naejangsanensis]MBM3114789.1 autotransporter domain-containing protein [Jeongeupia naejangsanensis]